MVQTVAKIGSIFGSTFLKPLERFRRLLGVFLGPPKAVLDGLGSSKTMKNCRFFKVFANACFCDFEALKRPLRAHLGPS